MRRVFSFILFVLFYFNTGYAQFTAQKLYGNEIFNDRVGTIEFYPRADPLGYPLISLYDLVPLELKFDLLITDEDQLYYSIDLCNSDWTPSELDYMDYLNGYPENSLYAFSSSFNTFVDYVHYKLKIPNEDVSFLKSGNYVINIYHNDDKKEMILSRRFIVYEPATILEIDLDNFQSGIYTDRQALNIVITPTEFSYEELVGYISLKVMQNGNWHTAKTFTSYNTNGQGQLTFNKSGQIVFDGGNEYRIFDVKSLKFISERIDYIEYKPPYYHVHLKPDKLTGTKQYFSKVDLNGKFFIWNQESNDEDLLDAEYVYVHFNLATEIPFASDVFIDGELSDWRFKENYMQFNTETGSYEKSILLKQGIYNYRYVTKDYNSNQFFNDITEGEHSQTGNDYHAFLYYRNPSEFYDRVIGYNLLSTGKEVKEHDKERELTPVEKLLKEIAPK